MARLTIVVLLLLVIAASAKFADRADELFEKFKKSYARKYKSPDEEAKRKQIFRESMERVDHKNELNGEPVFGVTKFSDWTIEEFKALLGFKKSSTVPKRINNVRNPFEPMRWNSKNARDYSVTGFPSYVNWGSEGILTPVKNQGQCGACWAFSVAETIESEWAFQGNPIWEFSPQQVCSCTTTNSGCGGGDPVNGYEYIEGVIGLGSSWFAPYTQSMYVSCTEMSCTIPCSNFNMQELKLYAPLTGPYATLSSYSYATPACTSTCTTQNTTLLAQNIATYGPASVCVNAETWNDYTGGVLTQTACGDYDYDSLDHCVQLIGYSATSTTPYWIVRNSWSTDWGINGFIQLQYPQNTCGVADHATFVEISNSQSNF